MNDKKALKMVYNAIKNPDPKVLKELEEEKKAKQWDDEKSDPLNDIREAAERMREDGKRKYQHNFKPLTFIPKNKFYSTKDDTIQQMINEEHQKHGVVNMIDVSKNAIVNTVDIETCKRLHKIYQAGGTGYIPAVIATIIYALHKYYTGEE